MMMPEACRGRRELLGAHALGHLTVEDQRLLDDHVGGCPWCSTELVVLRRVASAMSVADPQRFGLAPRPPAELETRMLARVREARAQDLVVSPLPPRRRLARLAAVAAAAVIAAFVLVWALRPSEPRVEVVAFPDAPGGVTATAHITARDGGTEVELTVRGLVPGEYAMALIARDGREVRSEAFRTTGEGSWHGRRSLPLPRDASVQLTLVDEDGRQVISAPLPA